MLTEYEITRIKNRVDGVVVLDSNLKEEILQSHVKEMVKKVTEKLKRTKGRLILFIAETR